MADVGIGPLETYLVEGYRPGFSAEALREATELVRAAADRMRGEGKHVRYVRSAIVPADESWLSFLEADSERLVREAYERAGVLFDRISTAISPETTERRAT